MNSSSDQSKLRICIASWAPFHAGAEVAAERLALGLQAAGHEVLIVLGTRGETLERMQASGLCCEFVPMTLTDKWRWWRYADARRQLLRIFRVEAPDLVHFNDLPTSQMAGQAADRLNIPRLCHHRFPFSGSAFAWLNKFGAERHVFVSQALLDQLCDAAPDLALAPRAVVHDGLPLPPSPRADEKGAMRQLLGLAPNKALVLLAGQVVERKGVADLIQAWQLISAPARAQAELLIVGDDLQNQGQYRSEMERLAQQIGCPARFLGFQRNIEQWLTASDIAVVPSHVEPLGNATLEAMAHALPVVGSNVGGIPEMIVHEETGLLVPPKSPQLLAAAIERLIDNPLQRQQLGAAGRTRCEQEFSLEVHTAKMLEEYQLTIAARGSCLV